MSEETGTPRVRVKPVHISAAAFSLTIVALLVLAIEPSLTTVVRRVLTVMSASGGVLVVLMLIHLDITPQDTEDFGPLKSAFSDYAGYWAAFAILLMWFLKGEL